MNRSCETFPPYNFAAATASFCNICLGVNTLISAPDYFSARKLSVNIESSIPLSNSESYKYLASLNHRVLFTLVKYINSGGMIVEIALIVLRFWSF